MPLPGASPGSCRPQTRLLYNHVVLPPLLLEAICFLLGLIIGSFLNVVIARLPDGRSIVRPPSACPACGGLIRWYDNVPLLSWLWLRARCRNCQASISWRYPAVELLTAVLFMLAARRFGPDLDLAVALLLLAALVAITGIDLDHQIIPDVITLPGIAVGAVLAVALHPSAWLDTVLGVLVGGGLFFVIILASRGGMGGGDMKLGAMMGAFLGWKLVLLAILLGVFAGGAVAVGLLVTRAKGRKDPVPFGPFLALGAVVSLLWGHDLLAWYLNRFVY
jgi:leader peptidase (prepilin peptidase) / N-methyltransferase